MNIMYKIGFKYAPFLGWLGGVNYFRNLIWAITSRKHSKISPVLLSSSGNASQKYLGEVFFSMPTSLYTENKFPSITLNSLLYWLTRGHSAFIDRELRTIGIDVLSHSYLRGYSGKIPFMAWIPDFQHIHFPDFFSAKERRQRDKSFQKMARKAKLVLLSSAHALEDFRRCFPEFASKGRVLHFASHPFNVVSAEEAREIIECYDLRSEFFYLPNQFWVHKNHQIVIKALSVLKRMEKKTLVVASGHSEDYRSPGYYQQLCDLIKKSNIDTEFRYLGVVPYKHVLALMKQAIAVINPSFFEGWSTTVEEAKSMGKLLLLSDIPVHREQAPPEGRYFDPNDELALVDVMLDIIQQYDRLKEDKREKTAESQIMSRIQAFGDQYESYVCECLKL